MSNQKISSSDIEILMKARELGWFENPRQCNFNQIAESLNMNRTTFAEIYYRSEKFVMKQWFIAGGLLKDDGKGFDTRARQQWLRKAIQMGYYENPGQVKISELYDAMGAAREPTNQHLSCAENEVWMEYFLSI